MNAIEAGESNDPDSNLPRWVLIATGYCVVMDAENAKNLDRRLKADANDDPEIVAHLSNLKKRRIAPNAARDAASISGGMSIRPQLPSRVDRQRVAGRPPAPRHDLPATDPELRSPFHLDNQRGIEVRVFGIAMATPIHR